MYVEGSGGVSDAGIVETVSKNLRRGSLYSVWQKPSRCV